MFRSKFRFSLVLSTVVLGGVALFSNLTSAAAQEMKRPAVHPGDVLKYDVRIEGSGAEKFNSALLSLNITTTPREDQNSFQRSVESAWESRGPDHLFHVTLTVPKFIPTGDYAVHVLISADLYGNGPRFGYEPPELSAPIVHIENDYDLHRPNVVVIPRP